MRHHIWILVMLCGCGEPILKNAPKPDPGAVAGVAAAAAAAATLADPQGAGRRGGAGGPAAAAAAATLADPQAAGRRQEQKTRGEPDNRGVEVKETVPADVF